MSDDRTIAVRENGAVQESGGFTRQQVDLIRRTIANGASDDELQLFISQAQRMGLDPFVRQIHFVKRGSGADAKGTIQVAIDGYRLIADRTGKYAGNDDPLFEGEEDGHPVLARVTVWKLVQGQRCPFTATARWSEYVPQGGQGFMWKRMPHVMLGKVAEALALRKAFPAELSGTYTDAEMDQAEPSPASTVQVSQPRPAPAQAAPRPQRKPGPTLPLYCADCREPIGRVVLDDGGILDPQVIAQKSHEAYDRALCINCSKRAQKAKEIRSTKTATVAVEGEIVGELPGMPEPPPAEDF